MGADDGGDQKKVMTPREIREALIATGDGRDADELVGCTELDIACLENHCGLKLPGAYKEFLRQMGRHRGYFLGDWIASYPSLVAGHNKLIGKWKRNPTRKSLARTAFVFASSESTDWLYFDTADGDEDPPVFYFCKAENKQLFAHFSEWIHEEARAHFDLRRRIKEENWEPNPDQDEYEEHYRNKLKYAPFKDGETAQFAVDLLGVPSGLDEHSKVDIPKGSEVMIESVLWLGSEYLFLCEVIDVAAQKLIALVDLKEHQLLKLDRGGA